MKKALLLICLLLVVGSLSACGRRNAPHNPDTVYPRIYY